MQRKVRGDAVLFATSEFILVKASHRKPPPVATTAQGQRTPKFLVEKTICYQRNPEQVSVAV